MAEQAKKEAAQEGRTDLNKWWVGNARILTLEEVNAAVREYLLTSGCTSQSGKPGETPQSRWGQ